MSSDAPAPVVELAGVTKVYDRQGRGLRWQMAVPWADPRIRSPHRALDEVDLVVGAGETVGIIGPNGAGKSTILKLVAGVTQPTSGVVHVRGSVGAMIELGVGFHPELTGWENVRCGAVLRGVHASELGPVLHEIAAFAGIEDAMSSPMKKYSTGMRARLAFALATQFPADVLVVDEVLAVGDPDFQTRCLQRVQERVAAGAAVLFVSHEMRLVSLMCDRSVRIDEGTIVDDGPTTEVVARYLKQSPTRFQRSDHRPMRITQFDLGPEAQPWGHLEIDAVIEVVEPIRQPTISVDFTIPTLNPDLVHVVANDKVPGLRDPGRYRLSGRSHRFGVENLDLRVALTASDGVRLSDVGEGNVRIGGSGVAWSYLAVEPSWHLAPEPVIAQRPSRNVGVRPEVPDGDLALRLRGVVKGYRPGQTRAQLRSAMPGSIGAGGPRTLHALDGVDLDVACGEAVGIIGPNGAGKSTLLRVVGGLTAVDRGAADVRARVVPMLDFGSGMHPHLSGLENLRVRGRFLGISAAELDALTPAIIEFADIGDAIDAPVHQYSSGMLARLGFSIAIHAPGEILLIDELLAVGDEDFRTMAITSIERRRREGATVLFVSHEMQLIEQTCGRVVRMEHGRIVDDFPVTELVGTNVNGEWAAGVHDATSGIRMSQMRLRQRKIPIGGSVEFHGTIEVDEPAPHARLELSYRATPEDRSIVATRQDRNIRSFYLRTVEPSGGFLSRPGRYAFACTVHDHWLAGGFDLALAVVDDREDVVLAEAWQEVLVGQPNSNGMPTFVTAFDWTVEPIDAVQVASR